MIPTYFSIIGYLSVILWICVPLLWFAHKVIRPRRWLCHIALGLAVLAFAFAKINSLTYVNRIQLDRTEEMAAWEAKQEAARKMAESSRGEDVAQIRFAEDAQGDFLDSAGMDEADLKYFDKVNKGPVPDWKMGKKQRSESAAQDDSLEGLIGGGASSTGMESESLGEAAGAAPVMMLADELAMAQRLDGANLQVIRLLILLGIVIVIVDYLRRANVYNEAYLPLRLPSAWLNACTRVPALLQRPDPARRSIAQELEWLNKRGDAYLYLGDVSVPESVLQVTDAMDDDFIFESLWYGRSSFAVDSADRAEQLLVRFTELLKERKATRARVGQTVHLVLDRSDLTHRLEAFVQLAAATGFSLFNCK
ncbi:MAG: hypothetical protein ACI9QL_004292 [Candidatus Omnitrophota bacterium]|jgi:hypothetical protein